MKFIILFTFISIAWTSELFQNGDLIFQESKSRQSKAIKLATKSSLTHMGIIFKKNGKTFVYEAVQPVKLTPISSWIKRGKSGKYFLKRLKKSIATISNIDAKKMSTIGNQFKGKNYDLWFNWSNKEIYCSELVYKIYDRALNIKIGALQKLKHFDLESKEVKHLMNKRYKDKIPLNEKVISPLSMFNSPKLELIYEGTKLDFSKYD